MCSRPSIPTPEPVIQRQAYRSPTPRGSSGDPGDARRRRIAGMETSTQGVTDEASTTRRVKMGGDNSMMPALGGGGAPTTTGSAMAATAATASLTPLGPVRGAQTSPGTGAKKKPGLSPFGGPIGAIALNAIRRAA